MTKVNEETPKNQISFSINGKSYVAEEGMTWGEWVKSGYNTTYADNYKTFEKYIKEYYKLTSSREFTYADNDPVTAIQNYKDVKGATHVLERGYIFISSTENAVKIAGKYFYDSNGNPLGIMGETGSDYITQNGSFYLCKNTEVQYGDTIIQSEVAYKDQYID